MQSFKIKLVSSAVLLATVAASPAPTSPVTDEFVAYLQKARNNDDFGLRDGKYYPYTTVRGWRIGHRQSVADKKWFRAGWPKAEADQAFRAEIESTAAAARAWATKNKVKPFDQWSLAPQQIFIDLAQTEGVDNLSRELTTAIVKEDWQTLVMQNLYLRWYSGAPDLVPNHAFGQRWVYSKKLIPNLKTGPDKADDDTEE